MSFRFTRNFHSTKILYSKFCRTISSLNFVSRRCIELQPFIYSGTSDPKQESVHGPGTKQTMEAMYMGSAVEPDFEKEVPVCQRGQGPLLTYQLAAPTCVFLGGVLLLYMGCLRSQGTAREYIRALGSSVWFSPVRYIPASDVCKKREETKVLSFLLPYPFSKAESAHVELATL